MENTSIITVDFDCRIKKTNELNKFLSLVIPAINKRLEQGYKLNKNGEFFKKDLDDLKAIIDSLKTKNIRCWFECNIYSIWLKADIYGMGGIGYLKQDHFLLDNGKEFKPNNNIERFAQKSKAKVQKDMEKKRKLEKKIDDLKSQLFTLKSLNRNFIK